MINIKRNINHGFTLLEVVIFLSLFTTIFLTITYANLLSIKNNKITEHKIIANYYAESLTEWLRGEKDASWSGFLIDSQLNDNPSLNYCFNDINFSWPTETVSPPIPTPQIFQNQCDTNFKLSNRFSRQLTMTKITGGSGETQIEADINIRWYEGSQLFDINLNTLISQYE